MGVERPDTLEERYHGHYLGVVKDNVDPEGFGRVESICPAICGRIPMFWAQPLSSLGGGIQKRGLVAIPPIGAMVVIVFLNGDENFPMYLPGWNPTIDGESNLPMQPDTADSTTPLSGQKPGDPDNTVWETKKWRILIRDENGTQRLRMQSKDNLKQFIEIDGKTGDITLNVDIAKQLLLGDFSATELAVLGTAFQTLYNAHSHASGTLLDSLAGPVTGVTGPPVVPMAAAQLSTKVKVAT